MNPSSRWGKMWQGIRRRRREIALIVVLLLVNYLIFSRLAVIVRGDRQATPTATRTPKPTFTPDDVVANTPTSPAQPTPTFQPTPVASPTPVTHIVQPGETLSGIARTYGTTADAVVQANRLENADAIREGQLLLIPSPGGVIPTAEATTPPVPTQSSHVGQRVHVIQQGETLSGIARMYGTTAQAIVQANGLDAPDAISVGQALVIP